MTEHAFRIVIVVAGIVVVTAMSIELACIERGEHRREEGS